MSYIQNEIDKVTNELNQYVTALKSAKSEKIKVEMKGLITGCNEDLKYFTSILKESARISTKKVRGGKTALIRSLLFSATKKTALSINDIAEIVAIKLRITPEKLQSNKNTVNTQVSRCNNEYFELSRIGNKFYKKVEGKVFKSETF